MNKNISLEEALEMFDTTKLTPQEQIEHLGLQRNLEYSEPIYNTHEKKVLKMHLFKLRTIIRRLRSEKE